MEATRRSRPRRSVKGLLDAEPDLVRFLSQEQRAVAERFALPLAIAEKDDDIEALLRDAGAFGALVLTGLLVQAVSVDTQRTLRLIGPGGHAPIPQQPRSIPSQASLVVAAARTELVLLGDEFLLASRRWPWLVHSLHARMMEQSERLMTQLAICQLPRVEDRLIAMMWLLAERWGRVTPAGVRLPLSLSHETLGELIGARRPTVTLAIKKLAERNTLIRQDHEWLILEQPAAPLAGALQIHFPVFEQDQATPSTSRAEPESDAEKWQIPAAEATRVLEDCAHETEHARRLCSRSTELCEQSRELNQAIQAAHGNACQASARATAEAGNRRKEAAEPPKPYIPDKRYIHSALPDPISPDPRSPWHTRRDQPPHPRG